MPSALLTNTDHTKVANLLKLLRGDTVTGWTTSKTFPYLSGSAAVAPTVQPGVTGGQGGNGCARISVEADPNNGGAKVYVGDGDVSSTNYGKELLAGTISVKEAQTNIFGLSEINLITDTDNALVTVEFNYA